jgi:hypothetical protein
MGVTAGIFLASILLKEMSYLVYIRYLCLKHAVEITRSGLFKKINYVQELTMNVFLNNKYRKLQGLRSSNEKLQACLAKYL